LGYVFPKSIVGKFMLKLLIVLLVMPALLPAQADSTRDSSIVQLVARLDLERYKATIKGLTNFGDRRQGTDRNRAAVDWIEAQLRSYGCSNVARLKYDYQPSPPSPEGRGGQGVRLSLMEAIRKMTLMPAQRLEARVPMMRQKGRLRVGADADITIFDPATVIDRSTYREPTLAPIGIQNVIVNGVSVVANGHAVEGVAPGKAVRSRVLTKGKEERGTLPR
jgi:hypothetical protein